MSDELSKIAPITDPVHQTISAYDQITDDYAKLWLSDSVMTARLDNFLNLLDEPNYVLDAGCGPGRDVAVMSSRGIDAAGIDLSASMIAKAREISPGMVFRQMDQRDLKFPPNTFDGIWSCAALHHLPEEDILGTLEGFARVLKRDGILCAIVKEGEGEYFDQVGRFQNFYSASEFRDLLKTAGFNVIDEFVSFSNKGTLGKNKKKWLEVLARRTDSRSDDDDSDPDCLLCYESRFKLCKKVGLPGSSGILWGDNSTYVIPDIAPLMEGHLLLVTEPHFVCLGASPESILKDVRADQTRIKKLFRQAYGQELMFLEHGPVRPGTAGACINHAHLHCLPASLAIKEELERLVGPPIKASFETLQDLYSNGQSYLYVEEEELGWAFPVSVVPSQLLRKITMLLLGKKNWQWQTIYSTPETKELYHKTLSRLLPYADKLNL